MPVKRKIAVVGAGFAGAVIARELAESGLYTVEVFDSRSHAAGNCHTARDARSNVMVHEYGPHIFNTSRADVWTYVNKWAKFSPYVNRVKAITRRGVFSLPINLLTINQFFGKIMNPREAEEFIRSLGDRSIAEPRNFEEQALQGLGRELYDNFFYGYTKKQWGVEPRELPASILKRLPVRFSYDDNYYQQSYQGIPVEGYTFLIERILEHEAIHLHLSTRFERSMSSGFDHVFTSGPIDAWFGHSFGRLRYRSLTFERIQAEGDYQGNAIINYCDESVPHTRITEHKHFTPWETHENTTVSKEFSKLAGEGDVPYYPLRLPEDMVILAEYQQQAKHERGVTFCGRLGTYRYLDMHVVIGESLDLAKICLSLPLNPDRWPSHGGTP